MDEVVLKVLRRRNEETEEDGMCRVVFVLGDHGMTHDGNHGGGTYDEVSAGEKIQEMKGRTLKYMKERILLTDDNSTNN